MTYRIFIQPKALKSLAALPTRDQSRVKIAIDRLADNLSGDVKRLRSFSPAYRLRVGNYRVLFDVDGDLVIIEKIGHRRDVYDR